MKSLPFNLRNLPWFLTSHFSECSCIPTPERLSVGYGLSCVPRPVLTGQCEVTCVWGQMTPQLVLACEVSLLQEGSPALVIPECVLFLPLPCVGALPKVSGPPPSGWGEREGERALSPAPGATQLADSQGHLQLQPHP